MVAEPFVLEAPQGDPEAHVDFPSGGSWDEDHATGGEHQVATGADCPLTDRELEILRLMALEGLQQEGIAYRLRLKASTVRSHVHNAYRKLGVTTSAQALVVCFNAGWIDPMQTRIQNPLRFRDNRVTDEQRAYLAAFHQHLTAGDDERELHIAKRRTDGALIGLCQTPSSDPARHWMDRLVDMIARKAQRSYGTLSECSRAA